ncbi:RsmB/NOP family class I SAM-dependent RNA methyltransferase [Bartonella henselae]|uniref:RsmB/NOP family class I SAM-dependent RNA methyltransferase n=1 Tax=Bartonella henselae TaxID=38323 RepID=UPI0003DFA627|nr:RsmB/NOP family class I SAM-dependent RNA methyltransferase [Bartonella henselae]ETS07545.1 ribosomal RNA small subunit methyltransferase B [Bartonella henselae JK 42]ETS16348.1 ribosomal RNA small subunit methyltransferase B [Bartonella henselae JK 41]KEC57792.1 ribosomal RNA small subunit methyltransferase B [Bartonella henselae str. Zeus]KEC62886.1 ribosomal RNA small subunit methyltransferase B [Bartonella henselae JK 53]MDM9983508.1 RsmB/NOP family class I SAM-dependent RNA methyltrans
MRLGGRLQAAIDVLKEIEIRHRPIGEALKDWGVCHRFAGASDRAAIGTIVYDVLRRRYSLQWRMESDDIRDSVFGTLLDTNKMTIEQIDGELEGDRFAPQLLGMRQRQSWQRRQLVDAPDYIRGDIPQWCQAHLRPLFADNWVIEAAALATRPSLDLRVNSLKATPEKVFQELAKNKVQSFSWFRQALRIAPIEKFGRHPNLQVKPAFQKGHFEIQDLGSQIVAHLVEAKERMQVLDYCAGAGGKTLALAASMKNQGQIYAYDSDKARLAPIFDRLRRAGVRNVQPRAQREELQSLVGRMDRVLLDAPCSGTGTWRRHPDTKWRLTLEQVRQRQREQRAILNETIDYLKLNGRLVYITCSLFVDENEEQISRFLQQHCNFYAIDMRALWKQHFSSSSVQPVFSNYGLTLSPATTKTDGFFLSVLQKKH